MNQCPGFLRHQHQFKHAFSKSMGPNHLNNNFLTAGVLRAEEIIFTKPLDHGIIPKVQSLAYLAAWSSRSIPPPILNPCYLTSLYLHAIMKGGALSTPQTWRARHCQDSPTYCQPRRTARSVATKWTWKKTNSATLRITGPCYRGVWLCIAGVWDLQTTSFEIPWILRAARKSVLCIHGSGKISLPEANLASQSRVSQKEIQLSTILQAGPRHHYPKK